MLKLPPPVWALIYVGAAAALSALAPLPPAPHSVLIGGAVVLFGLIPAVWAVVMFRRAGTELPPTSATNKALVTTGPYALTRNPMYLSLVVITAGVAIWSGSWAMWLAPIATFATANWVHIPFEEAKMGRQFGPAFGAYCAKVRRWL